MVEWLDCRKVLGLNLADAWRAPLCGVFMSSPLQRGFPQITQHLIPFELIFQTVLFHFHSLPNCFLHLSCVRHRNTAWCIYPLLCSNGQGTVAYLGTIHILVVNLITKNIIHSTVLWRSNIKFFLFKVYTVLFLWPDIQMANNLWKVHCISHNINNDLHKCRLSFLYVAALYSSSCLWRNCCVCLLRWIPLCMIVNKMSVARRPSCNSTEISTEITTSRVTLFFFQNWKILYY